MDKWVSGLAATLVTTWMGFMTVTMYTLGKDVSSMGADVQWMKKEFNDRKGFTWDHGLVMSSRIDENEYDIEILEEKVHGHASDIIVLKLIAKDYAP